MDRPSQRQRAFARLCHTEVSPMSTSQSFLFTSHWNTFSAEVLTMFLVVVGCGYLALEKDLGLER